MKEVSIGGRCDSDRLPPGVSANLDETDLTL